MNSFQLRILTLATFSALAGLGCFGIGTDTRPAKAVDAPTAWQSIFSLRQDDGEPLALPQEDQETDSVETDQDDSNSDEGPENLPPSDQEDETRVQDPTIPSNELRQRMQQEAAAGAGPTRRQLPTLELKAKVISLDGSASVVVEVDGIVQFLAIDADSLPTPRLPSPDSVSSSPLPQGDEIGVELISVSAKEVVLLLHPFEEVVVLN